MTALHQELLNIELPVIQAPMAGVQDSALVIAVAWCGVVGAQIVAGGTDLYPNMKRRQREPKVVVSLRRIAGLRSDRAAEEHVASCDDCFELLEAVAAEAESDPESRIASAVRAHFDLCAESLEGVNMGVERPTPDAISTGPRDAPVWEPSWDPRT